MHAQYYSEIVGGRFGERSLAIVASELSKGSENILFLHVIL